MTHLNRAWSWIAVLMLSAGTTVAQNSAPVADPQIAAALKQVSAQQIRANIEKLVSFYNRSTLSGELTTHSGAGIIPARLWIKQQFEGYSKDCGGCLEVKTDAFTELPMSRIPKPTEIVNVYAVQKGTDPENAKRVYIVTGHYDSRNSTNESTEEAAPGANDDGSGTAVSLECARVLSKYKFPATIIYLTVAGEEQGLNGSRHFAKMAKAENWDVDAVLNNDIVGGNRTPGDTLQDNKTVRVFSEGLPVGAQPDQVKMIRATGEENDSPSRELARYIASIGQGYFAPVEFYPTLIFRSDRFLRGGDHTSFNEQGYPAVRFTEWREDYNHQHQNVRTENGIEYGDLAKFVDFAYVANVARLNAATLASLASAPAPPANVKMLTKNLENDTTLTWEPSPGGLAKSYEVLWRSTTAPTWEHSMSVGDATKATLKQSKDNVIFAVQAVDGKGHRSLPVVPAPER